VTRTTTTRLLVEQLPIQTTENDLFEAKFGPGKKSLVFLFEEINALKGN
jgi:hypothetical protein